MNGITDGVPAVEGVDVLADGKPLPQSEWERFGIERADLLDATSGTITMFERHGKRIRIERRTSGVQPSQGMSDAIRDIDTVLAALVDIKPMADYGEVGTYDTVQARRQKALAKAEESLLALRLKLSAAYGVEVCPSCGMKAPRHLAACAAIAGVSVVGSQPSSSHTTEGEK